MQFTFESIIYIIAIFQTLQIMLIFYKIEHIGLKKNIYLYIFLILIILPLFNGIINSQKLYIDYPHLLMVTYPTIFLYGVTFYFYVLKLTQSLDENQSILLHLSPFFISLLIYTPYFFGYSKSDKIAIETGQFDWDSYSVFLVVGMTVLEIIHIAFYMRLSLKQLKKYQIFIDNNYSTQKEIELRWLERLIYSLFAVLIIYFIDNFGNFSSYSLIEPALVLWIFFFYLLNLEFFNTSKNIIDTTKTIEEASTFEKKVTILPKDIIEFETQVNEKQLYLELDLTLSELSRVCNLPKYQITAILNQGLQTTFYDYINTKRIEYAKKLLLDTTYQGNVLDVSLDCGFKSRSAFYNAFKKYLNMTPLEYMKQNRSV